MCIYCRIIITTVFSLFPSPISSMVIRDLTLRSASSFGSFHLIRLLYDEYIFYLVEHKVAAHLGMTPVAVMGEMGRVSIIIIVCKLLFINTQWLSR